MDNARRFPLQVDHVDRIDIAGVAALVADDGDIALGAHLDCVRPEAAPGLRRHCLA
jgi:hypothetical protein